jgi:membrane protein involved in colicin uptake
MSGHLIVTVYQATGTCDEQALQEFVDDFLGQLTAAGGATGSDSGTSSSDTGISGSGTSTPTP